ncbi:MutS-related protein [Pseudothermotoga sp.]
MNDFVDGPTRSFTMIDEILRPFLPKTAYGRRALEDFSCTMDSEEQFSFHWSRLRRVLKLSEDVVLTLEKILERIPDLSHQIENGFLEISDFAKLKRFVFNFLSLRRIAGQTWDLPEIDGLWKVLWHYFGDGETLQLQSEKLVSLRKVHLETSKNLKAEFDRLCDEIQTLVGLRPRGEEFTVSAQVGRKLVESRLAQIVKDYGERWHLRLVDTERTTSLKNDLERLEEEMEREASKLLQEVRRKIEDFLVLLTLCERAVETVDLDLSRYRMYYEYDCCEPTVSENLRMIKGRFVPTLNYCRENNYEYYPLSLEARAGVTVLCGPNMGGKTTALKTLGAFVLLLHLGYPVPAEEFSSPIFKFVRYVSRGEEVGFSSFAKEIRSLVQALRLEGRKLLLLDEFGTSTNPIEGEALALAIVEHFCESTDYLFLTTHYPRVVLQAKDVYSCGRIKNFEEEDPHRMFDYSLVPNVKQIEKIGLKLAQKLGLPSKIVEKARKHCGLE